jgi:hypothetical protein
VTRPGMRGPNEREMIFVRRRGERMIRETWIVLGLGRKKRVEFDLIGEMDGRQEMTSWQH